MRYLSVCSGIEAATVAWHPLGWKPAAFSEIEAFPRAVLTHHYPDTPLHGDFTTIGAGEYGPIDLLVGGTPCQSFSVAGLRKGLADERGNLALEYLRLADRTRPEWLVWENVPGVLSSNGGKDFGAFLGGLAELGYGFAYAVLDAQFFGVPQRRRRVFVVGHLGDWRRAAAVLFERHSLSGDSPPRREKGQDVAGVLTSCASGGGGGPGAGTDEAAAGYLQAVASTGETAHCLNAGGMGRQDYETETLITAIQSVNTPREKKQNGVGISASGQMYSLTARDQHAVAYQTSGNCGAWETGQITGALDTNTDPNSHVLCFSAKDHGTDASDISPTLRSGGHDGSHANGGVMPAVAYDFFNITAPVNRQNRKPGDPCHTLARDNACHATLMQGSAVRRLTPKECERLQGFPDDYTLVPYRGKPAADGPRYKALGNSMAVPVMRWIGERIEAVAAISAMREAA